MPHRTLSLEEIGSAFRRCEEEPTMLSLRAVLSIGHEQISDRGKLVAGRNATVAGGVIAALALIASILVPPAYRNFAIVVQVAAGAVCLLTAAMVWNDRAKLETAAKEEKQIRLLVADSARRISNSAGFFPQPLSPELRATLRDSIRACEGDADLENLLSVH